MASAAAPPHPGHRTPFVAVAVASRRRGWSLAGSSLVPCVIPRRRWRPLPPRTVAAAEASAQAMGQAEEDAVATGPQSLDVDEAAVMKIVENLSGPDKEKALALWEENKRMRVKLAILEGVSELPASERMRALSLLKQNRSLRSKTNSLMASWEEMEGTVNSLVQAEVAAAGSDTLSADDVLLTSADMVVLDGAALASPTQPSHAAPAVWELGLSADGLCTLLASSGPLELAMAKAEELLSDNTDDILNTYWERELGVTPQAFPEPPQPSVAELSAAAVGDFQYGDEPETTVVVKAAAEKHAVVGSAPPDPVVEATVEEEEAHTEVEEEAEVVAASATLAVKDIMAVEVAASDIVASSDMPAAGSKLSQEVAVARRSSGRGFASGRGGMAAAAGLGAGLLAVAAGMEATVAMEIMATTALVTSAGSIMAEDGESGSVREKGAGAPALVAIAATLNAAEQMARSIDRALDSEMVRATSQALTSATKIRALAETPDAHPADLPAATGALQPAPAPVENVVFLVEKLLPAGQSMKVVGGCPELGDWDATAALPMSWEEAEGAWMAAAQLPAGPLEFKLVVAAGEELHWEAPLAGNRMLQIAAEAAVTRVYCVYDRIEALQVVTTGAEEAVRKAAAGDAGVEAAEMLAGDVLPAMEAALPLPQEHPVTEMVELAMPSGDEKLIVFRVQKEVPFGNRLKVVGGPGPLGAWDSERAVPMQWDAGHVWSARVPLAPGECEFKFVVASDSGDHVYWEAIPGNRRLQVPDNGALVVAEADFEGSEDVRVSIDEEALLLNGAPC
mmetsp:Transcript_17856/g.45762  ORF Transcript_17856/g.45762 Transcript_17856/m.45762 type:complete len:794 (-) Transcript_17856:330-2711(-)